jgi:Adaptor complexes medium subunit family
MAKRNDPFDPFAVDDDEDEQIPGITESFDPFGSPSSATTASEEGTASPPSPPVVSRISSKGVPLPPKLNVKLSVHEEATSMSSSIGESSSDVSIEGTVHAQVQCSDAMKNAPFLFVAESADGSNLHVQRNEEFVNKIDLVVIPKHEIGKVCLASYTYSNKVQHMPLLVERKVTVNQTSIRVAIQVRSKLSNRGNLKNFCISVVLPETIDGDSIKIVRGNGTYDDIKRMILWRLDELQKGESFMVSAQAKLWERTTEHVPIPVLLRCISLNDPISDIQFRVQSSPEGPSSVAYTTAYSFRLLHRLP